jgi:hypothetical protein
MTRENMHHPVGQIITAIAVDVFSAWFFRNGWDNAASGVVDPRIGSDE